VLLNSNIIRTFFTIIIFISLIAVYGCSAPGILGGGAASTMVIAEGDRSVGSVIDDATIKVQIASKFIASEEKLFLNLDSNIIEGRVLLTGIVETQESRIEAIRKVWEVKGVNEVINEIEVGDKTTFKEYAEDVWITTQIKGLAAKNLGLRALSYNFETIKGKVYIAGITSKKDQLEILINTVKGVKGVNEIVNYVIIKE